MQRYFFHVHDGQESLDEEGVEFADDDEARTQAVIAAGEALRDTGRKFWNHAEWQMVVTDLTGARVCTLKFTAE